jgi:hypothetical protein
MEGPQWKTDAVFSQMFSALFDVCGIMTAVSLAVIQEMRQLDIVLLVGALLVIPRLKVIYDKEE